MAIIKHRYLERLKMYINRYDFVDSRTYCLQYEYATTTTAKL